ncbi:MucBP domain-containing protein, partial [Companilactobacillus halodurans]
MNFKKKRLNKALEDKIYRVKLVHSKKGWLAVGLTFITLFSATMLSQKTVDASAVNNVAIANSTTSSSVQLWNNVTNNEIHKANRGLANGTAWKTAKAVKGVDGETYLLVGVNEYADAKQMDLSDETSSQNLTGVLRTSSSKSIIRLYTNPLAENGAQLITNRGLAKNTDWKTDIKVVANGETYYRVATNEWVKASDAYLVGESSRSNKAYTKNAPDENTNSNSNSSNNNGGSTPEPVQQSTITTKYVDEDGNEVADAKTEKANKGEKYTANSITV